MSQPAHQEAQPRRWMDRLKAIGAIPKTITATVGVVTGVVLILNTIPALPGAWSKAYHTFHPDPSPSNWIVFVSSDQFLANSYLSVLSDNGIYQVDYADPSQLDEELVSRRPGVVIVGGSSPEAPGLSLTTGARQLLTNNTRVLGMGSFGARLFDELMPFSPLGLRHAAGTSTTQVKLASNLPKELGSGLPSDRPFSIYETDDDSGVAIHDTGSLDVIQARRLAEANVDSAPCGGHFWSLMQQGDDYFWGYSQYATDLTDNGKRLFVNLINQMLGTSVIGPPADDHAYPPGSYQGTVGCQYAVGSYVLRVTGPGTIGARVTSKQPLELVLSEQAESATVRKLEAVSPSLIARTTQWDGPKDWLVTVAYRGPATADTRVSYVLTVDYPAQPLSNWPVWLVFGALVAAVLMILLGGAFLMHHGTKGITLQRLGMSFRRVRHK
jgi:hypothetical protein